MGAAACCSIHHPSQEAAVRRQTHGASSATRSYTQSLGKIKELKDFQSNYSENGPVKKSSKVTNVEYHGYGHFVCRKLKMSDMPCTNIKEVERHFQNLNSLEHPHLCKFIEAFEDKTFVYLIYEKANPQSLFEYIRSTSSLTEEEAADYMRQVAMALSVSHSQGIVHGRLSPRSIILAHEDEEFEDDDCELQVKVCDMGQAYIVRQPTWNEQETSKILEVDRYTVSPEVQDKEMQVPEGGGPPKGAEKGDMWALGVIFYHMLSGAAPFPGTSRAMLLEQVGSKEVNFSNNMWSKLSADAKDVVESLLRIHPGLRLSAGQLLRHPWVKIARCTFPKKRMVKLLTNLRTNVDECEFKRFVLRVIAEQLPRESKTADTVEQAFRCLDKNGDGVLTVEEVVSGLNKHIGKGQDNQELMELFAKIDRDGSGTLNVQEFISASLDQRHMTSLPVLWEAFNAFDKDMSGHVDYEEIDRIVKEIEGALLSKDQTDVLCKEIRTELEGLGNRGDLDFDQFVYIMQNTTASGSAAVTKDWNRMLWKCGVDPYQVRHIDPSSKRWDITKISPSSPRSVYRKRRNRNKDVASDVPAEAG